MVNLVKTRGDTVSKKPIPLPKAKEMSEEDKEQLIRTIEQEAYDNEVMYWGCTQAVLAALQSHLDIGNGEAFKAASAFAGGVAGTHEVCGALAGGVMAIGLAYGRAKYEAGKVGREQPESVEAGARASRLCEKFKEEFGSLRCSDIKVSIRGDNYKDYTRFDTIEAFEDHAKCGDVTGPAARLAAEIILQPIEPFAAEINAQLEEIAQVRILQKGKLK